MSQAGTQGKLGGMGKRNKTNFRVLLFHVTCGGRDCMSVTSLDFKEGPVPIDLSSQLANQFER